jgi:hypothetical protein
MSEFCHFLEDSARHPSTFRGLRLGGGQAEANARSDAGPLSTRLDDLYHPPDGRLDFQFD